MKRTTLLLVMLLLGLATAKTQLPVETTGPMTLNLVQGYSFDPLTGTPGMPDWLAVEKASPDHDYYIIQFPGPVRPEWKKSVERAGAELLWYIPRYAFVARIPTDRVESVTALDEVRWVGLYQPTYKLSPGLEQTEGIQSLIVVFHYPEDGNAMLDQLAGLGAWNILPEFNAWNKSVRIDIDASAVVELARLRGVYWIEPWGEITPDNRDCQWVGQNGYSPSDTTRTIWHRGVSGRGMIIGLTDTPMWMNHNATRDTAGGSNVPGPNHRKVVAYRGTQGSDSHGTHTSGTIVGDDDYVGGTSWHDGVAKHARLFFQNYNVFPSGWDMNVWFRGPDSGLNVQVDSLRALNHSMSLSRKDTFNRYVFTDMTADQFIWNHRKFLHCNSMGNYSTNQMGHPVIAKNIISVGATQNGASCRSIATFSSRGPTQDGRRKPQLVAPGENIYSNSNSNAANYVSMSGTSMSTPNMTGTVALIRQYFRMGYYPTGDTTTGTPMEISAALNKAVAIVGADNDISGYTVPDNNVGWGRVNLDSSLYFAGDESKLWVADDETGLETGDSAVYAIEIGDDARPFRVSLCWSDYPGTMQASMILVNDLDLLVVSPTGTEYKGNVYSAGQSQIGGNFDTLNVEECVRVNSPEPGLWTVKVHARNIPQGPQPFALAAIGVFDVGDRRDVAVRAIYAPVGQVDSGTVVTPSALVVNHSAAEENFDVVLNIGTAWADTQNVILTPGQQDTVSFADWTAVALGWHAVRCSTMLAGDENPANDLRVDSCEVIPATGLAEGGDAPLAFALANPAPNPFTRTAAVRYSLPRAGRAELAVYSVAGTLVRTLAAGEHAAGSFVAAWDGRDNRGRKVSSGVYVLRLRAAGDEATRKLILE
ncbi:MAG: S8 family serine peptidase [bacterium]